MQTIYDKEEVIKNVNKIRDKVEQAKKNGNINEYRRMMLAQFYEGLKLSTR